MAKVAIAQLVSGVSIENNLREIDNLMMQAKKQSVLLVVLPENCAFIGMQDTDKLSIAEEFGVGQIQESLANMARKYRIWLVAGTVFIRHSSGNHHDRVRAASLVFNEQGECVARYDKIHLFDVYVSAAGSYQESATIEPGNKVVVVPTPVGCLGLSVCYDLRFPELYRQLLRQGAEIFIVSSAFTQATGLAHWQVLLRARAIENLCYVLAPNQSGVHQNGRETYGHSMIVGPWGNILGQVEKEAGLVVVDIDLHHLHELRRQFPCNDHHVINEKE